MKPHQTLRNVLVHPKDKLDKFETCNCVYQIKCNNCDSSYIGETGKKFKTRLGEHKKDVDSIAKKAFTRSEKKLSQTEFQKSAITDHLIDWEQLQVLDGERERPTHQANSGSNPDPAPPKRDEPGPGGIPAQPHLRSFVCCRFRWQQREVTPRSSSDQVSSPAHETVWVNTGHSRYVDFAYLDTTTYVEVFFHSQHFLSIFLCISTPSMSKTVNMKQRVSRGDFSCPRRIFYYICYCLCRSKSRRSQGRHIVCFGYVYVLAEVQTSSKQQ